MKIKQGDRAGYVVGREQNKVLVLWEDTDTVEYADPKTLERHEDDEILEWMCDMMCR